MDTLSEIPGTYTGAGGKRVQMCNRSVQSLKFLKDGLQGNIDDFNAVRPFNIAWEGGYKAKQRQHGDVTVYGKDDLSVSSWKDDGLARWPPVTTGGRILRELQDISPPMIW